MYQGAPNPIQVQFAPLGNGDQGEPELLPLVLIHDSSGGTFNYFALGSLNRDVWAIHNPNYWEESPWVGGIDAMASHYIQLIEAAGISGPVVLGGWSFGGFVAIAMAHILVAGTSSVTITALLLIDTPHILSRRHVDTRLSDTVKIDADTSAVNNWPKLALKSMAQLDTMLEKWDLPIWEREGFVDSCHWGNQSISKNGESAFKPNGPPPALLVRCKRYVNNQENSSKVCLVDLHRHEMVLGWEDYHPGFIKAVVEVDGDHYSIFDINDSIKMDSLTASLREILAVIPMSESAHRLRVLRSSAQHAGK